MSVVLNTRRVGDVAILDVSGRITLGEGASTLRNAIRTMVREGHKKILLNLAEASYIDSSGLGVLVSAFATVTNQRGQLKLLNVISRVKDLLLITKLYTVFDVYDDEPSGIRSFSEVGVEARGD
jgi:anti-sigma B factor antagonist